MRMKRKKNLDERIAASSDYLITMKNESLDFQDAIKENHLLDFKKYLKRNSLFIWKSAAARVSSATRLRIKIPTKTFFALKETEMC